MIEFLNKITVMDWVDIFLAATIIYLFFVLFRKTKAVMVIRGIIITGIALLLSKGLKLQLVSSALQAFFAAIIVVVVVIFQDEIKRFFENIALVSLKPALKKQGVSQAISRQTEIIMNTVFHLGHEKRGALIVVKGKDMLSRYLHGGISLNGTLSEPLLKSIFDPHSAGHDGAVIIDNGLVTEFAAHLPLSKNLQKIKEQGLRHAAALGISETTDALCVVVSEETGNVSLSHLGEIAKIENMEELTKLLENFHRETNPTLQQQNFKNIILKNWKDKFIAFFLAFALWFIFVHESVIVYKSFDIPVQHTGLASDFIVKKTKPDEIKIILSARRRDFYFVGVSDINLVLKLFHLEDLNKLDNSYYEAAITASDIDLPPHLTIVNISTRNIRLCIEGPPVSNNTRTKRE
ncbi:MAG: diadenylate cyclase [Candidatus Omnitrophota bacterium]